MRLQPCLMLALLLCSMIVLPSAPADAAALAMMYPGVIKYVHVHTDVPGHMPVNCHFCTINTIRPRAAKCLKLLGENPPILISSPE